MNQMEVVEEYQSRSHAARTSREIAALLLVVSVIMFTLYGINRAQLGAWGGVFLAAGILIGVAAFALAALSVAKLRCPNCDRVLAEMHGAAYCPSCGAALSTDSISNPDTAGGSKRAGGGRSMARRAAAAGSVGRVWEPRSGTPGIDDFPEEAYPKNIRLFTTPNEMELTKRYIQLIDKDNRGDPVPARMLGRGSKSSRNILPEKTSTGGEPAGVRRPRGIIGTLSLESIIAIIAGVVILMGILMVVINTLR